MVFLDHICGCVHNISGRKDLSTIHAFVWVGGWVDGSGWWLWTLFLYLSVMLACCCLLGLEKNRYSTWKGSFVCFRNAHTQSGERPEALWKLHVSPHQGETVAYCYDGPFHWWVTLCKAWKGRQTTLAYCKLPCTINRIFLGHLPLYQLRNVGFTWPLLWKLYQTVLSTQVPAKKQFPFSSRRWSVSARLSFVCYQSSALRNVIPSTEADRTA